MGWRGNLRAFNATMNRIDRESKRKQRELDKRYKLREKMEELAQAKYDVEVFENYIEQIQSLHKEGSELINWLELKNEKAPLEPKLEYFEMANAESIFNNFKPNFLHKIFSMVESKKKSLLKNIEMSKIIDEQNYEQSLISYKQAYQEWLEQVTLAEKVLKKEEKALLEVIEEINPFKEICDLGTYLDIMFKESILYIELNVHSQNIIPNEVKSLLKSGKLSVKDMPKSTYNELYQDYICSAILRIAREIFAILGVDEVVITAKDELLNKSTGHEELLPILSVLISKHKFESLNLNLIDPSDSMMNFIHNIDFKKTSGFKSVERIIFNNI